MDNKSSTIVCDRVHDQILKSSESPGFDDKKIKTSQNTDMGGWSFLLSICDNKNPNQNRAETEHPDNAYVQPLANGSKLSQKSLEMCTESLGSETGNESGDDISFLALEATPRIPLSAMPKEENFKTNRRVFNFPPPIKSISGSYSCRVRCYRENGRLVLRAFRVSSPVSCFRVERNEGRLRLCFLNDASLDYDSEEIQEKDFRENDGEEEDMEGNMECVEGNIGNEKFRTLRSRCNGRERDQKRLLNWDRFWVAT